MKKIMLAIILMVIVSCATAQVSDPVTSKPLVDYPTISALAEADYFGVWDASAGDLYKETIANYITLIFNYDRVMNGTLSATKPIQLATSPTVGLLRGLSFSGNSLAYTDANTGALAILATADELNAAGLGDTTDVAYHNITNPFTGTNSFEGILYMNGQAFMPASATQPTGGVYKEGKFYFNHADNKLYIMDEADDWQEIGGGTVSGAYLPNADTLSGISALLNWYLNGIDFGTDNYSRLGLPNRESGTTQSFVEEGDVQWNRNLDQLEIYDGSANHVLQDADMVSDAIEEVVVIQYPSLTDADTLDWSDKDYTHILNTPQSGTKTFIIENYGAGVYSLTFDTQETLTLTFEAAGVSFYYANPGKPTSITGRWNFQFVAKSASVCEVTYAKFYDTAE